MADPRYAHPVAGISTDQLSGRMERAMDAAQACFPAGTGVCVFAFDFGKGGGMGYICNAERADMIKSLREWLNHQARQS